MTDATCSDAEYCSNHVKRPNPGPFRGEVFGIAGYQLPAIDAGISPDHGVFHPRRGFDLRFYRGDVADAGEPALRQLLCGLGDMVQVVDDDE